MLSYKDTQQTRTRREFVQPDKKYNKKHKVNTTFNGERLNASSLI